jgi:hypothetical protein
MPEDARGRYAKLIERVRAIAQQLARDGLPPEAVAEAVGRAVTARRPRTRYVIGRDAKRQAVAARLLPDRVMDRLIARRIASAVIT